MTGCRRSLWGLLLGSRFQGEFLNPFEYPIAIRQQGESGKLTVRVTHDKRVAGEASSTGAERLMINHRALCVAAAGPWARVLAFVSNAHFVGRAVRVYDALGPAAYVSVAYIFRGTVTDSSAVSFSAQRVRAASGFRAGRGFRFAS